ncbi:MAG: type II toxin-antitoxin system VapC family toxin [Burkholderiales bacterium]
MKMLLDTQAFLWSMSDFSKLTKKARAALVNPENDVYLSLASIWELAIKISTGKLRIAGSLEKLIPEQLALNNITQLDIAFRHVVGVGSLPYHHKDPFDRLLVSQATLEGMPILSADKAFDAYGIKRVW